jgi:hypothetical protein
MMLLMEGVMWRAKVPKYVQATFDVLPEIVNDNVHIAHRRLKSDPLSSGRAISALIWALQML